jgi:DNA repair exonuclease SbcCD ATPase subunit
MAQTKVDKRKFIESILSLEVFSDMLSYARNEHNDLKRDYEVLFTKTQTLEKSFNLAKQQLDYFEDNKKSKITDIEKKIEENKEKILTLKKEIFDLPDNAETLLASKEANISDELKTIKESYNDTYKMLASIKSNINVLDDQLKEIEKVGSICTTCKRAYSDDDVKHKNDNITAINKKKEQFVVDRGSINNELTVIEEQQNKKEQELDDIKNKKTRIKELTNNNKHTLSKISYIEENITDLNTEKGNVGNQTNQELEKAVKEYGNDFTTSKDRLKHIDHDLAVLECVKFVVSEEGVKSYIVRKVLTVLNARLGYYLNALHANCLCQFNEYFDEVITDEKNEQKSYFNFSGGERKRIDLACLFAFLDVRRMQGDVHFSTIFYDELLDSSLDDKGVELVLKVLRERTLKYNENCYIITHRGNAINTQVDNTVLLEKRNGLTYLL